VERHPPNLQTHYLLHRRGDRQGHQEQGSVMTESFPILSEVGDLRSLRRGQEIEVRHNKSVYAQGRIEQIDVDLGVIWMRDFFNERKMINTSDFSVWRYIF
jgi:hypothetical protein